MCFDVWVKKNRLEIANGMGGIEGRYENRRGPLARRDSSICPLRSLYPKLESLSGEYEILAQQCGQRE